MVRGDWSQTSCVGMRNGCCPQHIPAISQALRPSEHLNSNCRVQEASCARAGSSLPPSQGPGDTGTPPATWGTPPKVVRSRPADSHLRAKGVCLACHHITRSLCHNRCFQNFCCLDYAFLDYAWWPLADAPDPSPSPVAGQQPRWLGGSSHSTATLRSLADPSCHPPKTGCRGRTGKVQMFPLLWGTSFTVPAPPWGRLV